VGALVPMEGAQCRNICHTRGSGAAYHFGMGDQRRSTRYGRTQVCAVVPSWPYLARNLTKHHGYKDCVLISVEAAVIDRHLYRFASGCCKRIIAKIVSDNGVIN